MALDDLEADLFGLDFSGDRVKSGSSSSDSTLTLFFFGGIVEIELIVVCGRKDKLIILVSH